MITMEMLKKGYKDGIVHLTASPHDDGVVCQIGDYWFYFGGEAAEGTTVGEYVKKVPKKDILNEIKTALDDIRDNLDDAEYGYYEAILAENMPVEDTRRGHSLLDELAKLKNFLAHETASYEKSRSKGKVTDVQKEAIQTLRGQMIMELDRLLRDYGQPHGGFKRYFMVITAEDDRYNNGKEDSQPLTYWVDNPWDGELVEAVFGNNIDELFGDGENEGLFYQLYSTITGRRISAGVLDPDSPREEIEEYDEYLKESDMRPDRWYGDKPTNGRYCLITFNNFPHAEDRVVKYFVFKNNKTEDEYFSENPWNALFEDVFYGDTAYDICFGKPDGRYYQLFSTETGKCVGFGGFSRVKIAGEIEEFEKRQKTCNLQ